jgi:c-di-GMP-binding flagellar brake protein YcgR
LDITIKLKDEKLSARLMDISLGGMGIASTDTRIEDLKRISLSMDDYLIELPCEKVRRDQNNYGFVFGSMDEREVSKLGYFIDNCTKEVPRSGPTEIMR